MQINPQSEQSQSSRTMKLTKITISRLLLTLAGIFIALLVIELAAQTADYSVIAIQKYINEQKVKKEGVCRIMCIGESNTQGQYPTLLEEELNKNSKNIKYVVIDCGLCGEDTAYVADTFQSNLDKYKPNIVVAMIGVLDDGPLYRSKDNGGIYDDNSFVKRLKLYRLYTLVKFNLMRRELDGINLYMYISDKIGVKKVYSNDSSAQKYIDDGKNSKYQKEYLKAEHSFIKALERDPGNKDGYVQLSKLYIEEKRFDEAEMIILKALKNTCNDEQIMLLLSDVLIGRKEPEKAEVLLEKMAIKRPGNVNLLLKLAEIYAIKQEYKKAEKIYLEVMNIPRKDIYLLVKLGELYVKEGAIKKANDIFLKAHKIDPDNNWPIWELNFSKIVMSKKESEEIEDVLLGYKQKHPEASIELKIQEFYENTKQTTKGKNYFRKNVKLYDNLIPDVRKNLNSFTYVSYQKIIKAAKTHGVKMICMQYPVRSIEPLKQMLSGIDGLVFVSNEENFKNALRTDSYWDLFIDNASGDFGHCTEKGNRLVAENLAGIILKEVAQQLNAAQRK